MKLYSCRVALGSNKGVNPHHEVPKYGVTRAEVIILRSLHGKDAVLDLVQTGETDMPDMDIYHKLAETYPIRLIEQLFGIKLDDLGADLDDLEDDIAGERLTPPVNAREKIELDIPQFASRKPVVLE